MTTSSAPTAAPARQLEVALLGNPNTGKTTLFNRLTRSRQRVGNYPGVTVEKKVGITRLSSGPATVIDLPGTYSLAASSADERIVVDVLAGAVDGTRRPDVIVCVVDATNLMRNLFLASQVADTGIPQVVALNMSDAAAEQGLVIDVKLLEERLGVPVVPTVASRGRGVSELLATIERVAGGAPAVAPMPWPETVGRALDGLRAAVRDDTGLEVSNVELIRILFDVDTAMPDRLGWSESRRAGPIAEARRLLEESGLNPYSAEAVIRYARLSELLEGVVTHPEERKATAGESIDRLLTHRVWGLVIFVGLMYLVFQSIYAGAVPVMDAIDWVFASLGSLAGTWLAATPMLQSLVVDGVIAGVGSVVVFLPQILILFFFIAILEDSGYMARAAFLMDKLFSWCGLSGKSFVPMLSSYACAIPGVMATRAIEDPKARLTTILIAPLMSCSARLPVYVLLVGAFIEPAYGPAWAGFTLVAMHFVGFIVAIPVAFILNRLVLRGRTIPFVMEMPPYRAPRFWDVVWRMLERGKLFLKRAGTIIFAMTIIVWALCYFPRPESVRSDLSREIASARGMTEARAAELIETDYANELDARYLDASYMGRLGRFVQPVFAPAGFDWKITVGVLASFPAREVIIATLGITYNLGGGVDDTSEDLRAAMAASVWKEGPRRGEPVFTPLVAIAIMVFFALCMQCGSTVAVIARESRWAWALFAFSYMTVLAWLGAVATYQIGGALFGTGAG